MPDKYLIQNIYKIHTTEMGANRICRNLNLAADPIEWCKEQIINATDITRKGKNWYIQAVGAVITVNAHSYTIITAHKKKNGEK
jgi:hypothetical protein